MRPRATLVLAVAALISSAGCGGGDHTKQRVAVSPTRTGPAGPTRVEFAARADSVCKHGSERIRKLNRRPITSTQQGLDLLADLRRITKATIDELDALEPPPRDRATIEEWISIQRAGVPLLERLEDAARQQDSAGFRELSTRIRNQARRAVSVIAGFPFDECGRRPPSEVLP